MTERLREHTATAINVENGRIVVRHEVAVMIHYLTREQALAWVSALSQAVAFLDRAAEVRA